MPSPALSGPTTTGSRRQRWDELLGSLVGLLPAGPASVLVDGDGDQPAILAGRLAAALNVAGHPCYRLPGTEPGSAAPDAARPCISATAIRLADGARWRQVRRWDVVIWLRAGLRAQAVSVGRRPVFGDLLKGLSHLVQGRVSIRRGAVLPATDGTGLG